MLQTELTWYPTRQCTLDAQLHVSRSSGGRWRFDVRLTAEEPDVDGTIVCEAHIDQSVRVSVELFAPGARQRSHNDVEDLYECTAGARVAQRLCELISCACLYCVPILVCAQLHSANQSEVSLRGDRMHATAVHSLL